MPRRPGARYRFPSLAPESFRGLPGMLADSLPDRFGNALIDTWLAQRQRDAGSFNAVQRLCYVGSRGMGALEYAPALGPKPTKSHRIDVGALAELAAIVMAHRDDLSVTLAEPGRKAALEEILRIGSSAGGARAKALIAFNSQTARSCTCSRSAQSTTSTTTWPAHTPTSRPCSR